MKIKTFNTIEEAKVFSQKKNKELFVFARKAGSDWTLFCPAKEEIDLLEWYKDTTNDIFENIEDFKDFLFEGLDEQEISEGLKEQFSKIKKEFAKHNNALIVQDIDGNSWVEPSRYVMKLYDLANNVEYAIGCSEDFEQETEK